MRPFFSRLSAAALALACATSVASCGSSGTSGSPKFVGVATPSPTLSLQSKINHIIVIYQENWSFDSLFGNFPGANGFNNSTVVQVDATPQKNKLTVLPQPILNGAPDTRFPANLPPVPFNQQTYIGTDAFTGDPNHNFYIQQAQIDGGAMDRYAAYGNGAGGQSMAYFDATQLPEGKLAQQYTLLDNFAQPTFGGSFLNNMWMACACTPFTGTTIPGAANIQPYNADGTPAVLGGAEGRVTNDGYVVNTSYTTQYPQLTSNTSIKFVPPLGNPTLGDRLSAANVSWKFYSGGLTQALAGNPDPTFQAHHQSYLYFSNYAPGTAGASHIVDYDANFQKDLAAGNLPSVSWVKLLGANNEHPGYANLITGQTYVANLISQIQMSSSWKDTMIVVFYDEAGGHFDHVAPTPVDRWGPSTRVPAYIVSPFARRGVVDHTKYEATSILRTIEDRYNLAPLNARDANAPSLVTAFDFSQPVPQAFARQQLGSVPYLNPASIPRPTKPEVDE